MSSTSLYTILSSKLINNEILAEVSLNDKHPVFEGHFPNQPILPGVFILKIIKQIIENVEDSALLMQTLSMMKFLKIVDPSTHKNLYFKLSLKKENQEDISVTTLGSFKDETPFVKCKATYSKK